MGKEGKVPVVLIVYVRTVEFSYGLGPNDPYVVKDETDVGGIFLGKEHYDFSEIRTWATAHGYTQRPGSGPKGGGFFREWTQETMHGEGYEKRYFSKLVIKTAGFLGGKFPLPAVDQATIDAVMAREEKDF